MRNKILGLTTAIMLSMIAAGGLWAQELKFDGYLNSGLGLVADNSDKDAYYKAFGTDSESHGYRFRLNGAFTNEAKNAGVRFRLQSQRNLSMPTSVTVTDNSASPTVTATGTINTSSGYFSMPYVYGWVGFFENKITLTGGIVDDGAWTTADWFWIDDQGEGLGLLLKAEPIKGLNLGVGLYTISQQSGGNNQILNFGGALPNFRDVVPSAGKAKYTFSASYTMPDMFRLSASFRTKNQAAWNGTTAAVTNTTNYAFNGREETSQIIGEFRLLKVKPLTAIVVGVIDNVGSFGNKGNILLSETFAYKLTDDLNLGLNMAQFLYSRNKTEKAEPALLFNLWGSYAFGTVVPRIDLVYFRGGQSKAVTADKQWERRGFTARNGLPGDASRTVNSRTGTDDDYSLFSVRPSVKINVTSSIFLEIGDMVNFDFANFNGYAKNGNPISGTNTGNTKSRLTNIFYVDLKFSF